MTASTTKLGTKSGATRPARPTRGRDDFAATAAEGALREGVGATGRRLRDLAAALGVQEADVVGAALLLMASFDDGTARNAVADYFDEAAGLPPADRE